MHLTQTRHLPGRQVRLKDIKKKLHEVGDPAEDSRYQE